MGRSILAIASHCTDDVGKFVRRHMHCKITPNELGIILPDGSVRFQTKEAAHNCAKNIVVDALNCPVPHERAVILSENRILDIFDGGADYVPILSGKHYKTRITTVHGHPDCYTSGATTPISTPDCKSLLFDRYETESIVYNSEGAYSKLVKTKIPQIRKEKKGNVFKYIMDMPSEFVFGCRDIISKTKFTFLEKKLHRSMDYAKAKTRAFEELKRVRKAENLAKRKGLENIVFQCQAKRKNLAELIDKICPSPQDCKKIHNFWAKYAKSFGLDYSTNYKNV